MQIRINGKYLSELDKDSKEIKMYNEVTGAIRKWAQNSDGDVQNVQFNPRDEYVETLKAYGGGGKVNKHKRLPVSRQFGQLLTSNKQYYLYDGTEYVIEVFDSVVYNERSKSYTYNPPKFRAEGSEIINPSLDINRIFFMLAVLPSCTLLSRSHELYKFQNLKRKRKQERYVLVDKTREEKERVEKLELESQVKEWIMHSGSDGKVRLAAIYFGISNAYTKRRKIDGIRLAMYDKIISQKDEKGMKTCLAIINSEVDISLDGYIKVAIETDCFRTATENGVEFIGWVSEDGMSVSKNIVKRKGGDIYTILKEHLEGKKDEIGLFKEEVTKRTSFSYSKGKIETI